jgi:hypothetical protein
MDGLVRVDIGLTAASIAVLAAGLALMSAGTRAIGPGRSEPATEPATNVAAVVAETAGASEPDGAGASCATFDQRFYFDQQSDSFDERFASAFGPSGNGTRKVATEEIHDNDVVEEQPDAPAAAPSTPITISRPVSAHEEPLDTEESSTSASLTPDSDRHTAIYDIAARTVYLPNGHRLEAHSGLGRRLDDPRYVSTKGQGPTPPNVYNLALRERLFHGVRAIRLVPVEDSKMFGRDGILAHSYMLGPSGQSNGCVSFRNYPAFLNAFLKGEVNRLVVVEHLVTTAGAKAGPASGG